MPSAQPPSARRSHPRSPRDAAASSSAIPAATRPRSSRSSQPRDGTRCCSIISRCRSSTTEGGGVLQRADGMEDPQRRRHEGRARHRRLRLDRSFAADSSVPPPPAPRAGDSAGRGGRGGRGGARAPSNALVESFCFGIEPWNAKKIEAELTKRGLRPVADNDGKGVRELPREGSRRIRSADQQRQQEEPAHDTGEREAFRRARRSSRPDGKRPGSTISRSARRTTRRARRSTAISSAGSRRTMRAARTSA